MEFVTGMVVISSAGHDCGNLFVVSGADERYVYVADGKERKLDSPKRKNRRHIRVTDDIIPADSMSDKKLRKALNALRARNKNIAEESEKLV